MVTGVLSPHVKLTEALTVQNRMLMEAVPLKFQGRGPEIAPLTLNPSRLTPSKETEKLTVKSNSNENGEKIMSTSKPR